MMIFLKIEKKQKKKTRNKKQKENSLSNLQIDLEKTTIFWILNCFFFKKKTNNELELNKNYFIFRNKKRNFLFEFFKRQQIEI